MRWFKLAGGLTALTLTLLFWLYVGAIVMTPVMYLLGWVWLQPILMPLLETFIPYVLVLASFLLFWPDDSGPYLD